MNPDPTSLERLHDIVVPPPVPWWPPAPGWSWVLGALGIGLACGLIRLVLRWQRNRYRREALAVLARSEDDLADPARRGLVIAGLAELLKRAALTAWPRETVASLTGPAWLAFLDRSAGMTGFADGPGQWLERIAYEPGTAATLAEPQARELVALARTWLCHHRRETTPC
jgi:hypothetical protein